MGYKRDFFELGILQCHHMVCFGIKAALPKPKNVTLLIGLFLHEEKRLFIQLNYKLGVTGRVGWQLQRNRRERERER